MKEFIIILLHRQSIDHFVQLREKNKNNFKKSEWGGKSKTFLLELILHTIHCIKMYLGDSIAEPTLLLLKSPIDTIDVNSIYVKFGIGDESDHYYHYFYIHTHIGIHIHKFIHTEIDIHANIHVHIHTYTHLHAYTHTQTHTEIHTHKHSYIRTYTTTQTFIHIYSHTHIHPDRTQHIVIVPWQNLAGVAQ